MNCPYCHAQLSDQARFCKDCGHVIHRCPTCGRVLTGRTKYCNFDGTAIPQEILQDLPGPTTAEKKAAGKSNSNTVWIVLAAVLVVCILAAGGLLMANVLGLFGKDTDTAAAESGQNVIQGAPEDSAAPEPNRAQTLQESWGKTDATEDTAPIEKDYTEPAEPEPTEEPAEEPEEEAEYILPESDSRYLTEADIAPLTEAELHIARNEIYARHGRMFASPDLDEYFRSKSWYTPKYSPEEFDAFGASVLNRYEAANIDLIIEAEKKFQ